MFYNSLKCDLKILMNLNFLNLLEVENGKFLEKTLASNS